MEILVMPVRWKFKPEGNTAINCCRIINFDTGVRGRRCLFEKQAFIRRRILSFETVGWKPRISSKLHTTRMWNGDFLRRSHSHARSTSYLWDLCNEREAAAGCPAWYHAAHAVRGLQPSGGASKHPAGSFACGNQPPHCVIWSKPLIQVYFL